MKLCSLVYVIGALAVAALGLPMETNSQKMSIERRTLPALRKRAMIHKRRIFEITGNSSPALRTTVFSFSSSSKSGSLNPLYCKGCKAAIDLLRYHAKLGKEESLYTLVETVCTLFNIQSNEVCSGVARLFGPELVPILNSTVNSLVVCSFLLSQTCTTIHLPEWETPLPPRLFQQLDSKEPPPDDGPKLKVLHITDTHYDTLYTEGAKVNCGEPLCCRASNGFALGNEKGAGKWGDWNCDIPERTLNSMLEHASRKNPDLDYIIWTGDIPPHDIWRQSKSSNLGILRLTVAKIKEYFPNTPVYPAVGNHEAAPTDIFPPPGASKSISWLYDELDRQWRSWLPEDTSPTIRLGGFYTALVRPGLRIVSLNTNYCYHRNWWLMLNSTDPADQLKWFVGVLQNAEQNYEKVHVIAHIAPGQKDCLPTWRDNYYRIVSRFRDTITNHFYGHSHKDEFELYYSENGKEPVGVGFLGPSVTTYTNLNPGYRIYYVDGDRTNSSRAVLDYENWVLDLERSNRDKNAKWGKSYSAKSEYRMTSLSPKHWSNLYEAMKINNYLFEVYYRHSNKDSPQINVLSCDNNCKKLILCGIKPCN